MCGVTRGMGRGGRGDSHTRWTVDNVDGKLAKKMYNEGSLKGPARIKQCFLKQGMR